MTNFSKPIKNERFTLKAPITTTADDILIFLDKFSEKIRLFISCESSVRQTIHIKYQTLFSLKKHKKINCRVLQFCLAFYELKKVTINGIFQVLVSTNGVLRHEKNQIRRTISRISFSIKAVNGAIDPCLCTNKNDISPYMVCHAKRYLLDICNLQAGQPEHQRIFAWRNQAQRVKQGYK